MTRHYARLQERPTSRGRGRRETIELLVPIQRDWVLECCEDADTV